MKILWCESLKAFSADRPNCLPAYRHFVRPGQLNLAFSQFSRLQQSKFLWVGEGRQILRVFQVVGKKTLYFVQIKFLKKFSYILHDLTILYVTFSEIPMDLMLRELYNLGSKRDKKCTM